MPFFAFLFHLPCYGQHLKLMLNEWGRLRCVHVACATERRWQENGALRSSWPASASLQREREGVMTENKLGGRELMRG